MRLQPRSDTETTSIAVHRRRAKPRFLLLDESMRIALAEPEAIALLQEHELSSQRTGHLRLVESLEYALKNALSQAMHDAEVILGPVKQIVCRARHMAGPAGSFTALFIERESQREELRAATDRFALTRREVQVLKLMLEGMSGFDIASALHIAEGTVNDYFKTLLRKTDAKNRSEMLAKVLGYELPAGAAAATALA